MITMVMELTTEAVVPAPRLCVLGCTRRPQWAADQRNPHPKHHGLGAGQPQVADLYGAGQGLPEVGWEMPMVRSAANNAAKQGRQRGPQTNQGHGQCQGHGPGQHQAVAVRNAHDLHGIQFFGDAHHANLRCDGRARAPGDQDGGQQGPQLPNQRDAQNIHDKGFGPKLAQLQRHQIGQHHANQKPTKAVIGRAVAPMLNRWPGKSRHGPLWGARQQAQGIQPQAPDQQQDVAAMAQAASTKVPKCSIERPK